MVCYYRSLFHCRVAHCWQSTGRALKPTRGGMSKPSRHYNTRLGQGRWVAVYTDSSILIWAETDYTPVLGSREDASWPQFKWKITSFIRSGTPKPERVWLLINSTELIFLLKKADMFRVENCEPKISENSSSSQKISQDWITEREPAPNTQAYVFTIHPPVYPSNVSKHMYVYVCMYICVCMYIIYVKNILTLYIIIYINKYFMPI